jgi:hypothetical protein
VVRCSPMNDWRLLPNIQRRFRGIELSAGAHGSAWACLRIRHICLFRVEVCPTTQFATIRPLGFGLSP